MAKISGKNIVAYVCKNYMSLKAFIPKDITSGGKLNWETIQLGVRNEKKKILVKINDARFI